MTPCFVWFLLDRPSPSSWNKIINYVQAPDSTISLYRNISGFTGEPFRKIGWKVFQNFVRAPQRKMHKSANPNLKNPAANSNPKMIRWCTFFSGRSCRFPILYIRAATQMLKSVIEWPSHGLFGCFWEHVGFHWILKQEFSIMFYHFILRHGGQNAWNHSKIYIYFLKTGALAPPAISLVLVNYL